jgi:hypothetical protein
MKKILSSGLFLFTLMSASLISCSSEGNVDTQKTNLTTFDDGGGKQRDPAKGIHLGMKLNIARASQGCKSGTGICSYDSTTIAIGDPSKQIPIEATVREVALVLSGNPTKSSVNRTLRFEFQSTEWYNYSKSLFGSNNVILSEDWKVDTTEWNSWGLDVVTNFTAPAGIYPVTFDSETGLYGFTIVSSTM